MNSPQTTTSELAAVADAIRGHERFVLTTHENPDGDALGSLLAAKLALDQLGKDSIMVLFGDAPLPGEYAFMPLAELRRRWPDDVSERVLLAVDCANESRIADPEVLGRVQLSINVDHHHDNTRFGQINLIVADASSTVELTPELAEALYIALVTDTGRFQYTNTTPKALRLAAELVEAGADVHRIFQGVYESVQFAKLKLLARALERAQVYEGGRIVVSYLLRTDFSDVGAAEPYSEGIIDYLRAVEGADMAVLIREPPRHDGPTRRVSLRASASSGGMKRSGSASSMENGPISTRRSVRQCPPRTSATARTYVPELTRRSSRASPSVYAMTSSASMRERRVGISTWTPRRASLYARSPPIFTADAAGIGSSTSPRRPASRCSSSSDVGASPRAITAPSGSPVDVRAVKSMTVR